MPLVRSFAFHLFAPCAAQLSALLVVRHLSGGGLMMALPWLAMVLLLGGWIALLVWVPFGALHVLQAIHVAPGWPSARTQFLAGILNPSLAILMAVVVSCLAPDSIMR